MKVIQETDVDKVRLGATEPSAVPVSYTHLDVYKRQVLGLLAAMYGPVAGGLIGFIGHALIDLSWGCLLYTSRCV